MQRPLFTSVIVGFWFVTTGWLFVAKILPSFQPGSPPGQQALYTAGGRLLPVGWTVLWNERPVGWALTIPEREDDGRLLVDSHLHFEQLPVGDVLPTWAGLLLKRVLRDGVAAALDARGRLSIDPDGRLREFSSTVSLPGASETVVLDGTMNAGRVDVTIRAGEMKYEATRHLPDNVMLGDELSPQATLPGLVEGRRWTVPMYSPLRPGASPIEILHAAVGVEEAMYWDDRMVRVLPVAYRQDPSSPAEPRCQLWVERSGKVLKQETLLLGARLTFIRLTDDDAQELAAGTERAGLDPAALPPEEAR
jgi:hypothetical protein